MNISELRTHFQHKLQRAEADRYESDLVIKMLDSAVEQVSKASDESTALHRQIEELQKAHHDLQRVLAEQQQRLREIEEAGC